MKTEKVFVYPVLLKLVLSFIAHNPYSSATCLDSTLFDRRDVK